MTLRSGMWAVMFTDMVGSTEQRARLGDAIGDALRREHDAIIARAAERHAGFVVKGTGDGAMVAFSGATDAIDAAVEIQRAFEIRNRSATESLLVRVGISAGDLVNEGDDLHGMAANESARLCSAADAGEIVIGDLVRAMAGNRAVHPLAPRGALELKGIPVPVTAWTVDWTPPVSANHLPLPEAFSASSRVAFVGRDTELTALGSAWAETLSGSVRAVLVSGEPGIGKTRLVGEFAIRAHGEGALVLYGRCDAELNVAFHPFAEAARWYFRHAPTIGLAHVPEDLARLGTGVAEFAAAASEPLQVDPGAELYRTLDALAGWLAGCASTQPVLFVVDDLQWASRPTLLALRHILRTIPRVPLLLLVTYRDDEAEALHDFLADAVRLESVAEISLRGLDENAVLEIVEAIRTDLPQTDARRLADAVTEATRGNAFFVGEVVRNLGEHGDVSGKSGAVLVQELGIPQGVRHVVTQRLDRLGPAAHDVLQYAAISGADFSIGVLVAATGMETAKVLEIIEQAADVGLVEERAPGQFAFAHAIVRSALEDGTGTTRAALLHRQIATALESLRPTLVATIARHWVAAGELGDDSKVVSFSIAAGETAFARGAYEEAADHYAHAVDADGAAVLAPSERTALLIQLGTARHFSGAADFRASIFEAADRAAAAEDSMNLVDAALALQRGNPAILGAVDDRIVAVQRAALATVGPADAKRRAQVIVALLREMFYAPLVDRAALCYDAFALLPSIDDTNVVLDVLHASVVAMWQHEEVLQRVTSTLRELSIGDADRAHVWTWWVVTGHLAELRRDRKSADDAMQAATAAVADYPSPYRRFITGQCAAGLAHAQGRLDDARRLLADTRRIGEENGQADTLFYFAALSGLIAIDAGEAEPLVDVWLAIVDQWDERPGLPIARAAAIAIATAAGAHDDARRVLELEAASGFQVPEHTIIDTMYLALLGDAVADLGAHEHAAALAERLHPCADHVVYDTAHFYGGAGRPLGRLATMLGEFETAQRALSLAEDVETRLDLPLFRARTWAAQARLALERDGHAGTEEAEALVARAIAVATQRDAAGVAAAAQAALRD